MADVGIVAAPIVEGEPVCSMSIVFPSDRLQNVDYVATITQGLTKAADEISITTGTTYY